jgi:hypothetical protein
MYYLESVSMSFNVFLWYFKLNVQYFNVFMCPTFHIIIGCTEHCGAQVDFLRFI